MSKVKPSRVYTKNIIYCVLLVSHFHYHKGKPSAVGLTSLKSVEKD